ncbi:MAG: Unknown protein [uncultured Aureispira sp.]|uniref:Uncharacterized protein n=1 Tax=uncultured Aureispira sp. TaxID=1331704 RepID=A0A6S6UJ31_9BACT|nr:MAG: Unknown protein [uncultured Aureispira sp.]
MSLYRHNSNKPFIFTVLFLFLVVLLLIPLRPSVWERDDALSETSDSLLQIGSDSLLGRDSLVLTTVSIQDTHLAFVPNIDSTAMDTTIVVQTIETVDTTVITLAAPAPSIIEKAENTGPNPLFLLWWLFLFIAFAWLLYKWLTARWQKKYWLEYNAKLQPLASTNPSNSNIDFDFADLPLVDTALEEIDAPLVTNSINETVEEPILIEPDWVEVEEPEVDSDTIVDPPAEAIVPLPEPKITPKDLSVSTAKAPLASSVLALFFAEFFGRLPRIIFEVGRGITSIFSFFSTGNQKRTPLDLKWQDGVSLTMILFFIACKAIIFPHAPTSMGANIILGLAVWGAPALFRRHWGWGVLAILITLGEFIGLIVYVILQALKDVPPSEGGDNSILWFFAVSLGLSFLYWSYKKGWLPTFKSILSFVLITPMAYIILLPYINTWIQGDPFFYGFGDIVSRLIGLYILYLIITGIINPATSKKSKEPVEKITDRPTPPLTNTAVEPLEIPSSEKAFSSLSSEELSELFRTPNWYKKVALDQFDIISMPSRELCAQNEFIVLYLPDCINLKLLYLSNNNFLEIPYEISTLEQLEILDLSYNQINAISPEIEYLKNLKVLSLAHNNISEIPPELAQLSQLTQIDLTGNPLSKDAIQQLKTYFHAIILKFDAPEEEAISSVEIIESVPETSLFDDEVLVKTVRKNLYKELKNPEKVYALSTLMNKKLSDLPLSVLQKFPNLKSLFLNSNLFIEVPEAIYHLPTLTTLGLAYNKITSLPDRISTLQNLKELDLSGNLIHSFSPAIIQLPNLSKLNLSGIGLTVFPAFLLKMRQLESINLAGNHILRIPKNIQDLSNLKELSLSFSGINTIPDEIFALKSLRVLEWTGNNLERISPKIAGLENLEKLAIGFNENLESPTSLLRELPRLKELHLSGLKGGMKKPIILNVGILKKLQILWLSYNELQELPTSLFDLHELRTLSLANNKLTQLSERLGELSNLEYLYVEKNQLTSLPNSIKQLKKLRRLNLSNNPIDIKEKRALQRSLPHVNILF